MTFSRDTARIAFSAVLAVVGAAAVVGGLGYGLTNDDGTVHTGFLPAVAGGAVLALALVDVAQSVRSARRAMPPGEPTSAGAGDAGSGAEDVDVLGRTASRRNRMLIVVLGIVLGAVLLVPLIGFLLSMGALMLAITLGVERMRVRSSILVVVIAIAVVWLVFGQLLGVPLPTGLLGLI
ncbi:tripartite tricarboxylate transporter TctB family protein [Promicromonospora panici]|uniref:tripartite tricarboxylate transporter TctB family protein n=1 Tax=Promicromonospora panici TaxID=2219658 RepID=UPI00101DAEBC|nr:tripartite tricarboxylate transporter TctB family protein [Promicromonospora panici]